MKTFPHRFFAVLFLTLVLSFEAFAQSITVNGTVVDATGQPVIGAAVIVNGTTIGESTDVDGHYTLGNVPSNSNLVFSCVGMMTVTEAVKGRTVIDVVMDVDQNLLDETVVIGYGTIKKSDLTGAVSVVKPDDFKNRSVTSVGDALQGAAAGVTVRSQGGLGSLPSIQIRGTGNLTNTDPLYIIDGVPTSNNVGFNVNDIESLQVLKDASSAAIYGSRAANGVIIITTKKGQEGTPKIDYSLQLAMQSLKKMDFIEGDEWRSLMTQVYKNGRDKGVSTEADPEWYMNNTDWQEEFLKFGMQQEHNLAISGGGKNSKFRVSFGFMDNPGYTIGSNMQRFTAGVNSEFKLGRFTFGESVQFGKTNFKSHSDCTLAQVVGMPPIIAVHDDVYGKNGWGYGNRQHAYSNAFNVRAAAADENGYNKNERIYLRSSGWATIKLTNWLEYKLNLGATMHDSDNHGWSTGYTYAYGFTDVASSASASASRSWDYLIENTLSFNKEFGKHNVSAVVGQSYQHYQSRSVGSGRQYLISSAGGTYLTNVGGGTDFSAADGSNTEYKLLSYFGRVNYDFGGRYLLQGTVRADGTSRFSKGNKWGVFPSVSAGWHVSNEKFYNIPWMNDLKLRANYGTLGSQNVGNYDYQSLINSYTSYDFAGGQNRTNGQAITDIANTDITWETKKTLNIGLDMAFLDNRLQASVEYYDSRSEDVLYAQSIMHTVGSTSNPVVNSASITNKGVELTATWRDQINKNWSYSVSMNLSHNKNTLTGLGYGIDSYDAGTTLSKIGNSIGLFYLVKTDGLYQTDAEASADGIVNGAGAGDVKYIDFNGDGSITNDDRQLLKNKSPWPKLEASLNITVNYKNWSAQIFGFGQFFKWVHNGTRLTVDNLTGQSQISKRYYKNAWSEGHKHNNVRYPKESWNYTFNDLNYSDRWLERGDFFKFSTLSLAYNCKFKGSLAKVINSAKISLTAQNFLCMSGYTGFDPDFVGGLFTPGNAGSALASPRSLILGINLNF